MIAFSWFLCDPQKKLWKETGFSDVLIWNGGLDWLLGWEGKGGGEGEGGSFLVLFFQDR